jgi:type II secretory ATPase GspE/PulE/Tfp pilus assembly ATPase PilB-like protein
MVALTTRHGLLVFSGPSGSAKSNER